MIWLMCWPKYLMVEGLFSPADSGDPMMVNVAHIIAFAQAPPSGMTTIKLANYHTEMYVPGTPEQVARAISTWPDGRAAHIDMRSELA